LLDGSSIQYKHNGKAIDKIPDFMFDLLKDERKGITKEIIKKDKEKKEKPIEQPKEKSNNVPVPTNITDLIVVKYIDDFDTWLRIVWAMKQEGHSEEAIKKLSQKSASYSDEGFRNAFEKAPSNITVSQGTLNYYAKLSNKSMYYEIIKEEYDFDDICDDDFSNIVITEMGDDFVYQNDTLYTFYKEKWHSNDELAHKVIKNFLIEFTIEIIESENKALIKEMI
jgi:hypothetical protein